MSLSIIHPGCKNRIYFKSVAQYTWLPTLTVASKKMGRAIEKCIGLLPEYDVNLTRSVDAQNCLHLDVTGTARSGDERN